MFNTGLSDRACHNSYKFMLYFRGSHLAINARTVTKFTWSNEIKSVLNLAITEDFNVAVSDVNGWGLLYNITISLKLVFRGKEARISTGLN